MSRGRRLTETERLSIARERSRGVPAAELATRYNVSLKSIYNAANHGVGRQVANASRSRVVGIRVSDRDLQGFDAALARRGVANRSDAMRRLMLAANDILRPDDATAEELRSMSAALNRVGNNVNQVARRLNEAKLSGERLPYTASNNAEIRELAGLVFEMADQIQELFRARRRSLDLQVTQALAGLSGKAGHGSD
ncbi:plasmid mobilization relaxosome protein MobC [Roseovarius sp. D22-M7]|uniref:plasmid mobilization relaxosome protein MobC n=1 Tax=Roseovarius sp. D22-M7 TaxID=3127116 RepID=UPI0030104758